VFQSGGEFRGVLGEPLPHLFEPKIGKKCVHFYNIKNYPLIFFFKIHSGPPFWQYLDPPLVHSFLDKATERNEGFSGCAIIYMYM
jgi:hypothetical protein